jgi:predicted  nucleic acid-binding Zn-ribbon protein
MDESPSSSVPSSDPAPPVPDSIQPTDSDPDDLAHLPPEYQAVVRRLRKKVDQATTALNRLQAENERLRRRVETLEQRPAVRPDTSTLVLDDDPAALRDRISTFIEAIDTYLDDGADVSANALSSEQS